MNRSSVTGQEEWLRVLGKGMVTLPKRWRDDMGIESGDVVRARKEGSKVIIEPSRNNQAPYRIYSAAEIDDFLKDDTLPENLSQKIKGRLDNLLRL